jgi:hypothetical protein
MLIPGLHFNSGFDVRWFSQFVSVLAFLCSPFSLQIKDEVKGVLEFINYVYEIFGFKYELELSTVIPQLFVIYIYIIAFKSYYNLGLKKVPTI